jgi:hypothetical protein
LVDDSFNPFVARIVLRLRQFDVLERAFSEKSAYLQVHFLLKRKVYRASPIGDKRGTVYNR